MTPDEARACFEERFGTTAADKVAEFLDMVIGENSRQNLISPASVETIWVRHAWDSAQLVQFGKSGRWIDVGTGAGFPGMIVALLRSGPITLVEPRTRRAGFLQYCVEHFDLDYLEVVASKIEKVTLKAATISARAVAPVEKLLQMATHCATSETRWLLPRGRLDDEEVVRLRSAWQGMFHVEPSTTDPDSSILIIDGARPR